MLLDLPELLVVRLDVGGEFCAVDALGQLGLEVVAVNCIGGGLPVCSTGLPKRYWYFFLASASRSTFRSSPSLSNPVFLSLFRLWVTCVMR